MSKPYSYAHKLHHWTSYADPRARRGRQGRPYRRWKAQVLAPAVLVCARCGWGIDKTLPWRDPMSATAGHIIAASIAPELALEPSNGQPEHRICNLRAGNNTSHMLVDRPDQTLITFPRRTTSQPVATRRW